MRTLKLAFASSLISLAIANPVFAEENKAVDNAKITTAEINSMETIAAIDKNEIMLGVIASNKKASSGITDFAKMMIDMHGNNLTQILEMAHKWNVEPNKSEAAKKIMTEGMKSGMTLGGLEGKQFEKAYIDAMVKGHEAALKLIDDKLMQTAKSEEVKKFITDTRAVVIQHLDDAKKLQKDFVS